MNEYLLTGIDVRPAKAGFLDQGLPDDGSAKAEIPDWERSRVKPQAVSDQSLSEQGRE